MKVYLFACIEKNIGDDLFVKLLCERYPNVDFVITTQARYGSLAKIPNLHFSKALERWMWVSGVNPSNPIKKLIAVCLKKVYKCLLPKYPVGISIVGNAFKNMDYTGWQQSQWIRERIHLVKRFYLISTNFGPYTDEQWKTDFDRIYPQMADVCFRDRYSYDLFRQLPNARFAPDAVISIGEQPNQSEDRKNVIISLIDCAFRARSEKLRAAASEFEEKMVQTAKRFLADGYKVTFLNSNMQQDRPACDRILAALGSRERVEVLDYEGDLDSIFQLYKEASCVVATRLHTIVLAWLHRIPVVPVVYDIKVGNLLEACSFNADKYNITDLTQVTAEDIYASAQKYAFTLSEEIISQSQLQFQEIDKEFLS